MWVFVTSGYLIIGLAVAGFTLAMFPPQDGYRPPIRWLVTAVVSYVVLWPFLAMIGLGYLVGKWYKKTSTGNATTYVAPPKRSQLYHTFYDEMPN